MTVINNIPVPGMRVIKTAIAIFICLITMEIVDQKYSAYASIVAIVCIQKDIANSLQSSKERVLGTLMGASFGVGAYLFINYFHLSEITILSYFIIAFVMILLMMTTIRVNNTDITAIACIIYLSVVTFKESDINIYYFTLSRIIDTLIGIVVALIVNISINDTIVKSIKKFLGIDK